MPQAHCCVIRPCGLVTVECKGQVCAVWCPARRALWSDSRQQHSSRMVPAHMQQHVTAARPWATATPVVFTPQAVQPNKALMHRQPQQAFKANTVCSACMCPTQPDDTIRHANSTAPHCFNRQERTAGLASLPYNQCFLLCRFNMTLMSEPHHLPILPTASLLVSNQTKTTWPGCTSTHKATAQAPQAHLSCSRQKHTQRPLSRNLAAEGLHSITWYPQQHEFVACHA